MRALLLIAALWLAALPALADRADRREALFEALGSARSEADAETIVDAIWRHWMAAPDAAAQDMLDRALDRRRWYDFQGAIDILDGLVAAYPDYAEGWNQRATVLFMQENYDRSLADIDKVLALEPLHFGALAGKAVILMRLGRTHEGQITLQQAIRIHPWLKERDMLLPDYREQKL